MDVGQGYREEVGLRISEDEHREQTLTCQQEIAAAQPQWAIDVSLRKDLCNLNLSLIEDTGRRPYRAIKNGKPTPNKTRDPAKTSPKIQIEENQLPAMH